MTSPIARSPSAIALIDYSSAPKVSFKIPNPRFLPKFQIFAKILDFRLNPRFSPKFQSFAKIPDFRQNSRFSLELQIFAKKAQGVGKKKANFNFSRLGPRPPSRPSAGRAPALAKLKFAKERTDERTNKRTNERTNRRPKIRETAANREDGSDFDDFWT